MQEPAKQAVGAYARVMLAEYNILMAAKLGMAEYERDITVSHGSCQSCTESDPSCSFTLPSKEPFSTLRGSAVIPLMFQADTLWRPETTPRL